jgi:hypothetical protein
MVESRRALLSRSGGYHHIVALMLSTNKCHVEGNLGKYLQSLGTSGLIDHSVPTTALTRLIHIRLQQKLHDIAFVQTSRINIGKACLHERFDMPKAGSNSRGDPSALQVLILRLDDREAPCVSRNNDSNNGEGFKETSFIFMAVPKPSATPSTRYASPLSTRFLICHA